MKKDEKEPEVKKPEVKVEAAREPTAIDNLRRDITENREVQASVMLLLDYVKANAGDKKALAEVDENAAALAAAVAANTGVPDVKVSEG